MDKCDFCENGILCKQILPHFDHPWGEKTYRFEHVPAEVCDVCGEIYFDAEISQAMDKAIDVIEKEGTQPKRFEQLPVLDMKIPIPA